MAIVFLDMMMKMKKHVDEIKNEHDEPLMMNMRMNMMVNLVKSVMPDMIYNTLSGEQVHARPRPPAVP